MQQSRPVIGILLLHGEPTVNPQSKNPKTKSNTSRGVVGEWGDTGVEDRGDGGREGEADPTGERPNSSKSGVSMISIGNENVVSSFLVCAADVE